MVAFSVGTLVKESWDSSEMKLADILFLRDEMSFLRPSMKCFYELLPFKTIFALGFACLTGSSSLS